MKELVVAVLTGSLAWIFCTVSFAGEVTIRTDEYGVPYILADREKDGFFALGYLQAEDRLQTVLETYYRAEGRNAELDGPDELLYDIYLRQFFSLDEARAAYEKLPKQLQKNLTSFVEGVKTYLHENPDEKPDWLVNFGPEHIVLHASQRVTEYDVELADCRRGGIWFGLGLDLPAAINISVPSIMGYPNGLRQSLKFEKPMRRGKSNGWALAPSRVADGVSVLVSDSHSGGLGPDMFEYVMRAGDYAIGGISDAGSFMTLPGNGDRVAWGATSISVDSGDCYVFETTPNNPNQYRYGNEVREVFDKKEIFKVAEGDTIEVTLQYVTHNEIVSPVIARENGRLYVLAHANRVDAGAAIRSAYEFAKAKNVDEAQALSVAIGTETRVYADTEGNISVVRSGRVPIRPDGYDFTLPVPGVPATEWKGYHPGSALMHLKNPKNGYFHANNEEPYTWSEDGAINPLEWSRELINSGTHTDLNVYMQEPRGARSEVLLARLKNATHEDIKRAATETYLPTWEELRNALVRATQDEVSRSGPEAVFLRQILSFDGYLDNDSDTGARAAVWLETLFGNDLPVEAIVRLMRNLYSKGGVTATDEVWLRKTIPLAYTEFKRRSGHLRGKVTIGDLYRVRTPTGEIDLPLRPGFFVVGGNALAEGFIIMLATSNAYEFDNGDERGVKSLIGGGLRTRITVMGEPLTIYSVKPWGQSANPASRHYSDQAQLISDREFKTVPFSELDILAGTKVLKTLKTSE